MLLKNVFIDEYILTIKRLDKGNLYLDCCSYVYLLYVHLVVNIIFILKLWLETDY